MIYTSEKAGSIRFVLSVLTLIFSTIVPHETHAINCLVPVSKYQEFGGVYEFFNDGNDLLVGAGNGLYRSDGDRLISIGEDQDTGSIFRFFQDENDLLVVFDNGLYRREGDRLISIGKDQVFGGGYKFFIDGNDLLVGADSGLYRRDGDRLIPIGKNQNVGNIFRFFQDGDDFLVGAGNGLYQRDGDRLTPIDKDQNVGRVHSFFQGGDDLLVGASSGLYRRDGDRLISIGEDQDAGSIHRFFQDGNELLVNAENGIYRREGDMLVAIVMDQDIGSIYDIFRDGNDLLVNAENGIYRREGDMLVAIVMDQDIGSIYDIFRDGNDLLVNTKNGLYRREGDRLISIGKDQDIKWINEFFNDGNDLLVGASSGLYRRDGDRLIPIGEDQDVGSIHTIFKDGNDLLVGTRYGLFLRDGGRLIPVGKDQGISSINGFFKDGNDLLVWAREGLYLRDVNKLIPFRNNHTTGEHTQFIKGKDDLLVGDEDILISIVMRSISDAIVVDAESNNLGIDLPVIFKWRVTHPCARWLRDEEISINGVPDNWVQNIYIIPSDQPDTVFIKAEISFEERNSDPYQLRLKVQEETGEIVAIGNPVPVTVEWRGMDYVKFYGPGIGIGFAVIHTFIYVFFIIGARWYPFCWRLLTDPVFSKVGLWFYFALRHVGPLQRWILAPWFANVRKKTVHDPYLSVNLSDKGEFECKSKDLLDTQDKWQHLWITGKAGMGKTAVVSHLQSIFFGSNNLPSLQAAYHKYKTIPIIIPLREYRKAAVDPEHPEDWVFNVARLAVSAHGLRFGDANLFRAIMHSGNFLLILDGANEIERTQEIELFATSNPLLRLLVTSQTEGSSHFTNLSLPQNIHEQIEPLLCELLGDKDGKKKFLKLKDTTLLGEIKSGYDVRLIADLPEGSLFPNNRPDLYQLILKQINWAGSTQLSIEKLCKAAWEMWREGSRKLEVGKHIDDKLVRPLLQEGAKVLRILDGNEYEFRHDQMRAYLAASWAVRYEVKPIRLFEEEMQIWRLSIGDQTEVWNFFAELLVVKNPDEAKELWKWSTNDSERVVLQHALQNVLKHAGYDLSIMKISPVDTSLPAQ